MQASPNYNADLIQPIQLGRTTVSGEISYIPRRMIVSKAQQTSSSSQPSAATLNSDLASFNRKLTDMRSSFEDAEDEIHHLQQENNAHERAVKNQYSLRRQAEAELQAHKQTHKYGIVSSLLRSISRPHTIDHKHGLQSHVVQ